MLYTRYLIVLFLFCFLLSDLMVFEKPSFHTPLIYCERSTYACCVTTMCYSETFNAVPNRTVYLHA